MKTAGCRTFEPNVTKNIVVKGEMAVRRDIAQE
jgi:calcyphosin